MNGGFDFKFETDPYDVKLYNLMTATEYTDAMTHINDTLKPSRAKKLDTALLMTGVLMIPLAVWGVRHGMLTKKRKRLLRSAILEFNAKNPSLYMRWNRRPESSLTIERRRDDLHGVAPSSQALEKHGSVPNLDPIADVSERTPLVYSTSDQMEQNILL